MIFYRRWKSAQQNLPICLYYETEIEAWTWQMDEFVEKYTHTQIKRL